MRRIALSIVLALAAALPAAAENHGVTFSWGASPTAASCTAPCVVTYLVFIGPGGAGSESATPAGTVSGLSFTYDGVTMNALLGETVCGYVEFQEATGGLILTSGPSGEGCFSFPPAPAAPPAPTLAPH